MEQLCNSRVPGLGVGVTSGCFQMQRKEEVIRLLLKMEARTGDMTPLTPLIMNGGIQSSQAAD